MIDQIKAAWPRFAALFDKSSWLLIIIGVAVLAMVDWRTALTLAQWAVGAFAIGGLTIVISRVTFPQIKLGDMVEKAKAGELPAALVVLAVVLYCGAVFIGVALWVK